MDKVDPTLTMKIIQILDQSFLFYLQVGDPGGVDPDPDPTNKNKPNPDSTSFQPHKIHPFSFYIKVNIFDMFSGQIQTGHQKIGIRNSGSLRNNILSSYHQKNKQINSNSYATSLTCIAAISTMEVFPIHQKSAEGGGGALENDSLYTIQHAPHEGARRLKRNYLNPFYPNLILCEKSSFQLYYTENKSFQKSRF